MSQSRCRGCNKVIEWIEIWEDAPEGPKLKRIPLDPRAPTYQRGEDGRYRRSSASVSHFATCPNADQFSSSNKNREVDEKAERDANRARHNWYNREDL